ncbi:MAG: LacI family DNA-binding transcriptional regulator [Hyphomonadaceae bacterium]|nr:LacI family DNA-binding transcriptional regulator [Clostridia bacterium]
MATIDDIVRVSGVSRSTVFRFLSGRNVRPDAKRAIIDVMEQLNYKTDMLVKQQQITMEISISESFESYSVFAQMLQGITTRADAKGIKVHLVRRTGAQITEDYQNWHVEGENKGVIVIGKTMQDEEMETKLLVEHGIPHIYINRMFEDDGVSCVSVEFKKVAYEMVSYLIQKGNTLIGTCGNPKKHRVERDKLEAYRQALKDHGLPLSSLYYRELEHDEDMDDVMRDILTQTPRPTAYFTLCDSHAMKLLSIAQALGIKVPKELEVASIDDIEAAAFLKPTLTTMHIPFRKIGSMAVDALMQLITDRDLACVRQTVHHEMVIRDSTI